MFKKLRLKLTLFNVLVVGILFLLFLTGTVFMYKHAITVQNYRMMSSIAHDPRPATDHRPADTLRPTDNHVKRPPELSTFMPGSRRWMDYFYVRVGADKKIYETSPDLPISTTELKKLMSKTLKFKVTQGEIDWKGTKYRFLWAPKEDTSFTLVFLNTGPEKEMLRRILGSISMAGAGSMALVFFASLFMADRALIPIKVSWQRQKDFVADASHELRTPLAVIQTNLELIRGNADETVASQDKWLGNVENEAKRMAKLVDNLLFLARADSNQNTLEKKEFSLETALREASAPFEPLAVKTGLSLHLNLVPGLMFHGDEAKIRQLIVILLDNALKYTNFGGSVYLSLRDLGNSFEICVRDTGEGIDKEHLDKIFERFYRIDKARSRHSGGTGLGLAIARWIVQSHNGSIQVTSAPEEGSSFTVTLPKS